MKHINYYPLIFKLKVIDFHLNNKQFSIKYITKIFGISKSSFYNWLKLHNNNALVEKKKYIKKPYFSQKIIKHIVMYVTKHHIFSLIKILNIIKHKFNIHISKSSVYNILNKNNVTYKKFSSRFILTNKKKFLDKKSNFINYVKNIKHTDIISIDECSIDTHICPKYGWNIKGTKLNKTIFTGQKKRISLICAISNKKIMKYSFISGSATSDDFLSFITELIETHKLKNKHLLLDNASIHHAKKLKSYILTTSCKLLYNVPYFPEFNPIEKVFSKMKSIIRTKNNSNQLKLKSNVKLSLSKVSSCNFKNFFISSLTF